MRLFQQISAKLKNWIKQKIKVLYFIITNNQIKKLREKWKKENENTLCM
jgi:hypothetical protein